MNRPILIGASLGSFKVLEFKRALELYLRLSNDFNLNAVELRFEKERRRPSQWYWEANHDLVDFLDIFEIKGVHLPFVDLNPISQNQRIRKESITQLKGAIDKASELNVDYVVMHARGFIYGYTHEEQLNEWKSVIKEIAYYAEKKSIVLTIENADFLSNLKDLVNVIRETKSKSLKLTLDVGHAHMRRVYPLTEHPLRKVFLKMLDRTSLSFITKIFMPYEEYGTFKNFLKSELDLIFNFHLHDYDGRKDHISLQEGKIDFSFLSLLKNNFKGSFIFEVKFENNYDDFAKNFKRFMDLMYR